MVEMGVRVKIDGRDGAGVETGGRLGLGYRQVRQRKLADMDRTMGVAVDMGKTVGAGRELGEGWG